MGTVTAKNRVVRYKIGAVQLKDIQGDIAASLSAISRAMEQADSEGVGVLCFPECFLQGYTLDEAETKERALDLKSQEFQDVLDRLAEYEVTIILGLIEKDKGSFYNTAVVIQQGKLLGTYRKAHLFEKNFQPGAEYTVFLADKLKFGINICYDARFAEGAAALAQQGAKVIFYPLNNRLPAEKAIKYRDKHLPTLVDRAVETGCWIVSSDVIAQYGAHIGYGCTAILDPHGKVTSQVKELEEGMITLDIEVN